MARPNKTARMRAKLKHKWHKNRMRKAGFMAKKKAGGRLKISTSPKRPARRP